MDSRQAYDLASELPGVTVKGHFEADGFSSNKRMFLTIWHEKNQANIRLSLSEQRYFLEKDGDAFSEIDNAWGRQGWTTINFQFVEKVDFLKALRSAWEYSTQKPTCKPKVMTKSKKRLGKGKI